jgi:hypothetical protein
MTLNDRQFAHAQWQTSLNMRKRVAQEIARNRNLFPLPAELKAQGFGSANGRTRMWKGLDKNNPEHVAEFNDRLHNKLNTTQESNASYG